VLAAVLLAALGCGGPRLPPPPVTLGGTVKHYAPLAFTADAALPGQAVVLGADEGDGAMLLALPSVAHALVVEAMLGGSHAVAITLTAGPAGTGMVSTPPVGAHWLAELSRARSIASGALGKQVDEVSLSAAAAGLAEPGATAALIAGGWLAALTGEPIDPRATVVGTLDPDGTIGPIAGLPALVLGAIAHGKTRIGYPRGMRVARTPAGDVDVAELAKAHHAEAIDVGDVYDVYQLVTHKRLPAPVALAEADLALAAEDRVALEAAYRDWQARLAGEWAALLQLEQAGRVPPAITRMVRRAHDRSERAEVRRRAGQLVAALADVRAAWLEATAANATSVVVGKLAAGEVDGAVAAISALDPGPRVRAAFDAAGALPPTTIGGHLAMLEALQAALRGWALRAAADDAVRATTEVLGALRGKPATELGAPATAAAVADATAPAVRAMLRAGAELTTAEQVLARAPDRGVAYTCTPASVQHAATGLASLAAVLLRDAEASVTEPAARREPIGDDEARRRLAAREPGYAVADRLSRGASDSLPVELVTAWGPDTCRAGLLRLASAALVTREAAQLILGHDVAGVVDAGNHAALLRALIAGAQRTARARARAARIATGAVPLQARLAYQLAAVEATGSVDDQLDAIAELWAATAIADAAILLARN
jgi:hypothetical protein